MKKKWIIPASVALSLGTLAVVAVAERGENRHPMREMLEPLDLTGEQKEQLKELRMEAMRQHREAINEILTEEQRETMEAMRTRTEIWLGGKIFGGAASGKHRFLSSITTQSSWSTPRFFISSTLHIPSTIQLGRAPFF